MARALGAADAFQPAPCQSIGLPAMDGYEVAERLRRSGRFSATRLIAVSGYGQDADRARASAGGFTPS